MTAPAELLASELASELAAVRGELVRTDGKCAALAALAGAVFVVAAVAFTAAVLLVVLALRPRLGDAGFGRWAQMAPDQITACQWRQGPHSPGAWEAQEQAARLLHVLSVITVAKYRRLRLAAGLAAAGIIVLTAASIAAVSIAAAVT